MVYWYFQLFCDVNLLSLKSYTQINAIATLIICHLTVSPYQKNYPSRPVVPMGGEELIHLYKTTLYGPILENTRNSKFSIKLP